jgi:hypothetical protein
MEYNELLPYFRGRTKTPTYKKSVEMYEQMKIHIDGEIPEKMLRERRPAESKEQLAYREKIWKAVTYPVFNQVLESLGKIRRSKDWAIKFDKDAISKYTQITEDESPINYITSDFPNYENITNWAFSELLRNYSIDSNGVIAIIPTNINTDLPNLKEDTEYWKPYPIMFNSCDVLEFKDGELAILRSKETCEYSSGQVRINYYNNGEVFYVITPTLLQRWEQTSLNKDFALVYEIQHGFNELPARQIKGVPTNSIGMKPLYRSRLHSMMPRMDEALREYSDMQIEVVMHIFSEKWEYQNIPCNKCSGHGYLTNASAPNGQIVCDTCQGSGYPASSPFQIKTVRPANNLLEGQGAAVPTPPMGYVQKDVEIVKIQDGRIDGHIYKALSAINMQFLMQIPLNQSGLAKEVDRDELNNFVYNVAEDMVNILDFVCHHIINWRYIYLIPDAEERDMLEPEINVPERFDLLTTSYLVDEYKKANEAKLSPIILAEMQNEIAAKYFNNSTETHEMVNCVLSLDPLVGLNLDEKISGFQNKFITQDDVILSIYLNEFVRQIMEVNKDFVSMNRDEKLKALQPLIEEKKKANSSLTKLANANIGGNNNQAA